MLIKYDRLDKVRIDKYLSHEMDLSRSEVTRCLANEEITVNRQKVKPSYILKINDQIVIDRVPIDKEIKPESIELNIVFEDPDILILNKPAGMIVHPTETIRNGTLVNALMDRYDNLPSLGGSQRQGIVHRLDMDTTGIMIVAKTQRAMDNLKIQFLDRKIHKKYLAITHGSFKKEECTIDRPIGRSEKNRKKMTINGTNSKSAISIIRRRQTTNQFSLLEVEILTGRTHQIRVHLKSIGHPIVGDTLYGWKKEKVREAHQLLHAHKLALTHPITGEPFEFCCEPDKVFRDAIVKYKLEKGLL